MPKLFFRKELASTNPVLVAGKRVPFIIIAGNRGVIVFDDEKSEDASFIASLNDFAARRKYGIVKINEEEFEELKKKAQSLPPSTRRKQEKLKVMQPLLKPKQSPVKAVPGANAPVPSIPLSAVSPDVPTDQFEANAGIELAKEGKPLPDGASESLRRGYNIIDPATKLRKDGPTVEEYVSRGYKAENYPPPGYAAKTGPKPAPAFVPRTAPKPDAATETKLPVTK